MKLTKILPFLCVYHLAPVLGARSTIPNNDEPSLGARASKIGVGLLNKLGLDDPAKLEALKATAQDVAAAIEQRSVQALDEAHQLIDRAKDKLRDEYGLFDSWDEEQIDIHTEADAEEESIGNIMKACSKHDCKKPYFLKETMRWIKQALADVGVFIADNPMATAAFLIGASVLLAELITPGVLVPAALEAIGFGPKGPIKHTIASGIQRKMGMVEVGSIFARLQAAAMGGAELREIHKIANGAFTALLTAGAYHLVSASRQPLGQSTEFEPKEWSAWEAESRIDFTAKAASQMTHFWGSPTPEGCVSYGYREYRAPLWYTPAGIDPLAACVQTPAVIKGFGFMTPLGCMDERPKKGVIGTWYVQTNGTQCMPQWGSFEDEGCFTYGTRRKFARLLGLGRKDDWNDVCESTPAFIDDKHYDGPNYCEDKGVLGIYGVFDVADKQCECSCIRI